MTSKRDEANGYCSHHWMAIGLREQKREGPAKAMDASGISV
jgi:hypothetical protein